jgi:hypothetical protein
VDFSLSSGVVLRNFDHWRGDPSGRQWVSLLSRSKLATHPGIKAESFKMQSIPLLIMPFDELMAEVDARLLQQHYLRELSFDMSSLQAEIRKKLEGGPGATRTYEEK